MSNTNKEPTKEQQQHIAPSVQLEHTITREQIKQVIDNALGNNLTGVLITGDFNGRNNHCTSLGVEGNFHFTFLSDKIVRIEVLTVILTV